MRCQHPHLFVSSVGFSVHPRKPLHPQEDGPDSHMFRSVPLSSNYCLPTVRHACKLHRGLPCIAAWHPSNISQRWRTPPRIAHFQLSQKSCRRKTICLALWLALHHLHRLRPRCSFRCGIALCSRILPASQYTKADKVLQ